MRDRQYTFQARLYQLPHATLPGTTGPLPLFAGSESEPQRSTRNHATEKRLVRTVACYRSEVDGYELRDHSHRQTFSEADRLALLFLDAVTRIGEVIFSR